MKKFVVLIFSVLISLLVFGCQSLADPDEGFVQENNNLTDNHLSAKWEAELNYLFDLESVPKITITVSEAEWNTLLSNFDKNDRNEEMVHADFTFEGTSSNETISDIGFRVRGNSFSRERPEGSSGQVHSSSSTDWHQAHFRISFDKWDPDTNQSRFHGLRNLNLKFHRNDPTFSEEIFSYDLMRRFGVWTAAFASYARVYIQVEGDSSPGYFGVYVMIESYDQSYLQARFNNGTHEGNLWKCLWGATLETGYSPDDMGIEVIDPENDGNSYRPCYDLKAYNDDEYTNKYTAFTNHAQPQLAQFITDLNSKTGDDLKSWLETSMDVELFLKWLAVNVSVGMWDDYWANGGNNWYFYFGMDGKAYFVPYDYDNTLGLSFDFDPGIQSATNWGSGSAPLVNKVLSVDEYMTMYTNYLYELHDPANEYFNYVSASPRIQTWQNMVSPYIANDTDSGISSVWDLAGAGVTPYYHLHSGTANGNPETDSPPANYFLTRTASISSELGFSY